MFICPQVKYLHAETKQGFKATQLLIMLQSHSLATNSLVVSEFRKARFQIS